MALSELPIAVAKYFNKYSDRNRCFDIFKNLISLMKTDKPCGDDGDCYANTLDINSNPCSRVSDDDDNTEKN